MHLISIVGARPQFIKLAPLVRSFGKFFPAGTHQILHTGQHFDAAMSADLFGELQLPTADFHLGIHSLPHGAMTGRTLEATERILLHEQPDLVIVYGDTNATLAGALAAKKCGIPIAHVEAGLRSGSAFMPEEINRVLTDRLSDFLFCPSASAVAHLQLEGFAHRNVVIEQCGDVMRDVLRLFADQLHPPIGLKLPHNYVVATIHRAANTDDADRLSAIVAGLRRIAVAYPVVWPLHPRTRARLVKYAISTTGINTCSPQPYLATQYLLRHCHAVVTDSGGLQKEAFFHQKPALIVRERSEWVELVNSGASRLVTPDELHANLIPARLSLRSGEYSPHYGDGYAADNIWRTIKEKSDYVQTFRSHRGEL